MLNRRKLHLITRAAEKHNIIMPCITGKKFDECFTQIPETKMLVFWYRDNQGNVHSITEGRRRFVR